MNKITLISIFLLQFITVFAQKQGNNALLYTDVVVNDVIAIDTSYFTGFNYAKKFYSQSYENVVFSKEFDFKKLLVEKMLDTSYIVYQDYSPYGNVYSYEEEEIQTKFDKNELKEYLGLDTLYEYEDEDMTYFSSEKEGMDYLNAIIEGIDTTEIKGIQFYDKWFFNEKDFSFTKQVMAYCPIRRFYRVDCDACDEMKYRKTAWFVFPELKKRAQKKVEKRMEYLGRFEYEYSIENTSLFGIDDDGKALYLEEENSPNWNSFARESMRKLLIDRALSGKSKVFDYHTNKQLKHDQVKINLGYEIVEIQIENPETWELEMIKLQEEIKPWEIKSLLFIEDWYIDTETMRLKKEIIGIAPIRYFPSDNDKNYEKKVAFVLYFDENRK
ncbi:MAG: hypothetical protein ABFS35_15040 [Bacteroidota bacterium]